MRIRSCGDVTSGDSVLNQGLCCRRRDQRTSESVLPFKMVLFASQIDRDIARNIARCTAAQSRISLVVVETPWPSEFCSLTFANFVVQALVKGLGSIGTAKAAATGSSSASATQPLSADGQIRRESGPYAHSWARRDNFMMSHPTTFRYTNASMRVSRYPLTHPINRTIISFSSPRYSHTILNASVVRQFYVKASTSVSPSIVMVVESPTKATKIQKFLGDKYVVSHRVSVVPSGKIRHSGWEHILSVHVMSCYK